MDDYLNANQLEEITGTPASTFRYWAHVGHPPASVKIGRRRMWRRSVIEASLASLDEAASV